MPERKRSRIADRGGGPVGFLGGATSGTTVVGYAHDVSYGYVGRSSVEVIGTAPPPPG